MPCAPTTSLLNAHFRLDFDIIENDISMTGQKVNGQRILLGGVPRSGVSRTPSIFHPRTSRAISSSLLLECCTTTNNNRGRISSTAKVPLRHHWKYENGGSGHPRRRVSCRRRRQCFYAIALPVWLTWDSPSAFEQSIEQVLRWRIFVFFFLSRFWFWLR
ncbi:hypothetical protein VTH06DRAFT_1306 [Thermothelomyces fergusii]